MLQNLWTIFTMASVAALVACSSGESARPDAENTRQARTPPGRVDARCALEGTPTVVKRDGNSVLQYWTFPERGIYSMGVLPDDPALAEYRAAIQLVGADLRRPVADPPQPANEVERQIWVQEDKNVEVAFEGSAGEIRPIQCLDALLFAYQNSRFPEISHPTEFISSILRQTIDGQPMLKVYFSGGDTMFPPKEFYGFDEIQQDVAAGWVFATVLHNHTVQTNEGAPALGVPAPSTSDVDLMRGLASGPGLQGAWITNGFYTIEIPASAFGLYVGRN